MSEETHVYIITHIKANKPLAPVKIGISADPNARLRSLQTANHSPLVLLAAFMCPTRTMAKALESAFHEVMTGKRLAGEWFDIPPMRAVELMCENFRQAFEAVLGDEQEELLNIALEASGVLMNEEKLAKWKAFIASKLNDNSVGNA